MARDILQQAFSPDENQKFTCAENKFGLRRLKELYNQESFENAAIDDQSLGEEIQVIRHYIDWLVLII
jgi:hypothetical protein